MTDAHRELIEETRRRHLESDVRRGDCAWCLSSPWPCLPARLADALEQQERFIAEVAEAERATIARAGAAERRVADLGEMFERQAAAVRHHTDRADVAEAERDELRAAIDGARQ